jgi:hypothetical protein
METDPLAVEWISFRRVGLFECSVMFSRSSRRNCDVRTQPIEIVPTCFHHVNTFSSQNERCARALGGAARRDVARARERTNCAGAPEAMRAVVPRAHASYANASNGGHFREVVSQERCDVPRRRKRARIGRGVARAQARNERRTGRRRGRAAAKFFLVSARGARPNMKVRALVS